MDIGRTQIMDGPGSVTRISVGQRITTVAGRISPITAGRGFREAIWIGDRPGSRGEPVVITLAGRLCLHAVRASSMKDNRSAPAWTSNSISARTITTSATSRSEERRVGKACKSDVSELLIHVNK